MVTKSNEQIIAESKVAFVYGRMNEPPKLVFTSNLEEFFELSEEDRLIVARARKIKCFLSQSFFAGVFTSSPGKYVGLVDTIRRFKLILFEELDGLPEQAFYLVGNIDEATAKATNLEMESKFKK